MLANLAKTEMPAYNIYVSLCSFTYSKNTNSNLIDYKARPIRSKIDKYAWIKLASNPRERAMIQWRRDTLTAYQTSSTDTVLSVRCHVSEKARDMWCLICNLEQCDITFLLGCQAVVLWGAKNMIVVGSPWCWSFKNIWDLDSINFITKLSL